MEWSQGTAEEVEALVRSGGGGVTAALSSLGLSDARDFPVRTAASSVTVDGRNTQLLVCRYTHQLMVVATQLQTLGTVMHITFEGSSASGTLQAGESLAAGPEVRVLLGRRDDPLLEACARALGTWVALQPSAPKALLFALGLAPGTATTEEVRAKLLPALQVAVAEALQ